MDRTSVEAYCIMGGGGRARTAGTTNDGNKLRGLDALGDTFRRQKGTVLNMPTVNKRRSGHSCKFTIRAWILGSQGLGVWSSQWSADVLRMRCQVRDELKVSEPEVADLVYLISSWESEKTRECTTGLQSRCQGRR